MTLKCNHPPALDAAIDALDEAIAHYDGADGLNEALLTVLAEHDVDEAYNNPDEATTPEREALLRVLRAYAAERAIPYDPAAYALPDAP